MDNLPDNDRPQRLRGPRHRDPVRHVGGRDLIDQVVSADRSAYARGYRPMTAAGIADGIGAVLTARRQRIPDVQDEITQWRKADAVLAELERVTTQLCNHPAAPPGLAAQLEQLRIGGARPLVTRSIELVQRLEARLVRNTVSIGVSGAYGAGKSTLLRSISGLTGAELPTGPDRPVTAVPIRLYHAAGRRRSTLSLHTFESFRATHLQPRYAQAGLGESPTDVEAFRAAVYTEADSMSAAHAIRELKEIQAALGSYEGLLDRPGRVLELSGDEVDRLREYVTYPETGPGDGDIPAHKYLGVRDATVECPFPHVDHAGLTLVDLPAPRPGSVDVARRFFAALRFDVDVMLLVRPIGNTDPARPSTDGRLLSLLEPLRGRSVRREDVIVVVGNAWTGSPAAGKTGEPAQAFEVDVRDSKDVQARVLRPLLDHLATRLPVLDAHLWTDIRTQTRPVRDQLIGLAAGVKAVVSQVPGLTQGTAQVLYPRADVLHARLGAALDELLRKLVARSPAERRRLRTAVTDIHGDLTRWLSDGLGLGRETWYLNAVRGMTRDGPVRFCDGESVRIRFEIQSRYSDLDRHLEGRLDEVRTGLATILSGALGELLRDHAGAAALARLAELARTATEPCHALGSAVDAIIAARIDYLTYLHPRVSTALRSLSGELPELPPDHSGAEQLYQIMRERAGLAAMRTRARLLRDVAVPEQVLYAAVARFRDKALVGAGAEREIRQLSRAYRTDLWPDLTEQLDSADARVASVIRAADQLLAITTGLAGPGS